MNSELETLLSLRNEIAERVFNIENILLKHNTKIHDIAYQHWIPQIITALFDNTKWLSRGEYSMEYTLKQMLDDNDGKGISKFLS